MKARKADERYDAKEAYNKNLSGKARLHYLENDIHDKGMSMKAPMDMKGPMDMKSPVKKHHGSPADMKAPMRKEGKYSGNQPDLAGYKKDKQEKKDLMNDNPVVKDASGRRPAPGGRRPERKKPSLKDIKKGGKGRIYG